jgi:hypothetical protein
MCLKVVHGIVQAYLNLTPVLWHEGLFPFLGQNPTPENHAKLFFTIGIPSGLRSAYSKYKSLAHICSFVPFSCGTKSQLV